MGKTFKDGASAKYKKHIIDENELPIEFILGKKKQNIKRANYNQSKKSYRDMTKNEILED